MARKPNKYYNKKTVVEGHEGIVFDSRKEARHFLRLTVRQDKGEILNLKLQPKFELTVNDCKICNYIADFSYELPDSHTLVVEDVKSSQTSKNPVFKLKKKLMLAIHKIEVSEVL